MNNALEEAFASFKPNVAEYFVALAKFPTQACPEGLPVEVKERFLACAEYIARNLREIGITEVEVTPQGYVYATIPANGAADSPVIAFMAHYDTALENPSEGVEPQIVHNYRTGDIELPHNSLKIPADELREKIGHDIITGDGINQLGADDKAGVAAIMDMARFLTTHPDFPHGSIKLIFNNNEEVGRGTEYLDYDKLGADYAYCVDDGEISNLFEENFNAEAVEIHIAGITEHPGYAKGKMVNALTIAQEIITALRNQFRAPEESEQREPYLGLNAINGTWTHATVKYILRGFDKSDIQAMQSGIDQAITTVSQKYPRATINVRWDQIHRYENAAEILKQHPQVNELAMRAYRAAGVEPHLKLVRGGFDGVRMSFDGLPTTDVFNGAMNMHGLNEWVTKQDLELTVRMLVYLCYLWGQERK
jgi:tripeptide aminopeptidase